MTAIGTLPGYVEPSTASLPLEPVPDVTRAWAEQSGVRTASVLVLNGGTSPAASSAPVTVELSVLLGIVSGPPTAKCRYRVTGAAATGAGLTQAARLIADDAMRLRCGV